jgi:hypothetical protein
MRGVFVTDHPRRDRRVHAFRATGSPEASPGCPPPSGRDVYYKTWDIEGSLARPPESG